MLPAAVFELFLVQAIQVDGPPDQRETILQELAIEPVQQHQRICKKRERGFDRFDIIVPLHTQVGQNQARHLLHLLKEKRLRVTNDGSLRHESQYDYCNSLRINFLGVTSLITMVEQTLAQICQDEGQIVGEPEDVRGNALFAKLYRFSLAKESQQQTLTQLLDSLA